MHSKYISKYFFRCNSVAFHYFKLFFLRHLYFCVVGQLDWARCCGVLWRSATGKIRIRNFNIRCSIIILSLPVAFCILHVIRDFNHPFQAIILCIHHGAMHFSLAVQPLNVAINNLVNAWNRLRTLSHWGVLMLVRLQFLFVV